MWTTKPAPKPVQFLHRRTGSTISVSYSQPPPRNHLEIHRRFHNTPTKLQISESDFVGVLGQKILLRSAAADSKPVTNDKEMTGSDVLWAIQRATAQRNKKKTMMTTTTTKKKKTNTTGVEILSSASESIGDKAVDYSNVRSLRIKSDWGERLEEFEKLLKEFQETGL